MSRKIYFAGGLFDHKELTGNWLLANAIENVSNGEYTVQLPQHLTLPAESSPVDIRNADFRLMFSCDCIVANFDGCELDSGTVVEFCFAKTLDYPAVLLRTDFRKCGDQAGDGDPWNLMCSGYPRTKSVWINSSAELQKCHENNKEPEQCLKEYHLGIARKVVSALDELFQQKPLFDKREMLKKYLEAVTIMGGGLSKTVSLNQLQKIVSEKIEKGVYQ